MVSFSICCLFLESVQSAESVQFAVFCWEVSVFVIFYCKLPILPSFSRKCIIPCILLENRKSAIFCSFICCLCSYIYVLPLLFVFWCFLRQQCLFCSITLLLESVQSVIFLAILFVVYFLLIIFWCNFCIFFIYRWGEICWKHIRVLGHRWLERRGRGTYNFFWFFTSQVGFAIFFQVYFDWRGPCSLTCLVNLYCLRLQNST